MTYQIVKIERSVTSTGKRLARCILVASGDPTEIPNVTIWDTFPNFEQLNVGSPVEGTITVKQNGAYENRTLSAPRGSARAPKSEIKQAVEMKTKSIQEAQERKGDAIRVAGIARDATLLTCQELANMTASKVDWTQEDAKRKWQEWQKWLGDNWVEMGAPF